MLAVLLLASAGATIDETPPRDYRLYVAAESSDEVYLVHFDGETARAQQRISVGRFPTEIEGPHGLSIDPTGDYWYLTMAHGMPYGSLYKYTTGDNELVAQCELGLFPATMSISADTGLLYAVNFDLHGDMTPSSVSVVDIEEMVEIARTTTGAMPHGSRLSPDGTKHYSCSMMSDELYELDARGFDVTRTLRLDDGTGGAGRRSADGHHVATSKPTWVQPDPKGKFAYLCLNGAHQVVEVDLKQWKITRRFPTGKAPYNCEVSPNGELLVVTYKGAQAIGIWDIKQAEEVARLKTSRRITHGVVISPDGRYAFVSSEGIGGEAGTVDVFDLESHELVATAEIGLQAGGIAFWKQEDRD